MMGTLPILLLLLFGDFSPTMAQTPAAPQKTCSGCVCITEKYSKYKMPRSQRSQPLEVEVGFRLLDIYNVNVMDRTVAVEVLHQLRWEDARLTLDEGCKLQIVTSDFFAMLWAPDLDLEHFREFKVRSLISDQRVNTVSRQGGRTLITYSFRASATFECTMDLNRFPFSDITCKYKLLSPNLDSSNLVFKLNTEFNITQFLDTQERETYTLTVKNLTEADMQKSSLDLSEFDHSVVGFQFMMRSTIYRIILIHYFPTILMVTIAVFSFLLPYSVIPSRISTIMTPLLALLNFLGVITSNSPKGKGNTAVGIWIVFCILFGFMCFVCQLIIIKFKEDKSFRKTINVAFMVFMIALFALFNIFYWSTYLVRG